jgi:hypothetical protein
VNHFRTFQTEKNKKHSNAKMWGWEWNQVLALRPNLRSWLP